MGKKSAAKQSLFDGDDDGGGGGGLLGGNNNGAAPRGSGLLAGAAGADADDAAVLGFNPEYARRFEHNKRREELHRLKEKNPRLAAKLEREAAREALGKQQQQKRLDDGDGDDDDDNATESSSSSDDDDDLEELARRDDTDRVLEVLTRLKKKDPSIKQPEVRFFDDDEEDEEDEADDKEDGQAKKKKKDKPVYLRQVLAEQALEGGGGGSDDEDEEDEGGDDGGSKRQAKAAASRIPVYDAEQQQAKADFLKAAATAEGGGGGGGDDDDDFGLVQRGRKAAAVPAGGDGDKDTRVQKLLSDYFGADDDKLDPDEQFLKRYLAERKWLQEDDDDDDDEGDEDGRGGRGGGGKDDDDDGHRPQDQADDLEEDEQFLERADEFEHSYNFRFEQAGSGQIVGHPRVIPDAVRKKDDKRARARQLKAERKAAEKRAAEEELKRLKNLKKMEIQDKLMAVQEVAGVAAPDATLVDALLEGDFDPDEYDRRMAAAFGEDYYDKGEAEDADPDAVLKDARAAELLRQAGAIDEGEEGDEEGVPMPIGVDLLKKQQRQQNPIDESAAADARADVSRLMEEYYALDYEGTAGGLKTRFRYRSVEPSTGGLSIDEILALPDKELNQIVSLKLLAPYREGKIRPNYKALMAAREARQQQGGGKRRRPTTTQRGPAVRVEREGDGAAPAKPWHQKWKKGEQQQHSGPHSGPPPQQAQQDKQSARAASFAPLSLAGQKRRDEGGGADGAATKKAKPAAPTAPAAAAAAAPTLTKAQRKNLKRSLKRAAERQEKV